MLEYDQQQPMPATWPQQVMSADTDFYKDRLNSSDILQEIEHQLRGEVWSKDKNGKPTWKIMFRPDINEKGISDILNIIYVFGMNKNIFLGCLTDEEIYLRCRTLWKEMAYLFLLRGHIYSIPKEKRSLIIRQIVYSVHSGLTRSMGGQEAEQLSQGIQKIEHSMKTDQPQKKGIMNFASNWGRGRG